MVGSEGDDGGAVLGFDGGGGGGRSYAPSTIHTNEWFVI